VQMGELLEVPIVGAPLGGGPGTPALAAAVSEAGGIGFLAAGYKTAAEVKEEIAALRSQTERPFGVNLFSPVRDSSASPDALRTYAESLRGEEERYGVGCGEPRWSDDAWTEKLALVLAERPPVASFTFGCPERELAQELQRRGTCVWVTVTSATEAEAALAAGVDVLVVQGAEAGGHQGVWRQRDEEPLALLTLLQLVRAVTDRPLVAAGGIASDRGVAAVLAAGAAAAQVGTALMLSPEAGTSEPHREAFRGRAPTRLTRAFTGARARGIVNRFVVEHDRDAPVGYPEIHYLTAPLRARARQLGDADGINLWAGTAYRLSREEPAAAIVERLAAGASAGRRRAGLSPDRIGKDAATGVSTEGGRDGGASRAPAAGHPE
jgi:nitronate monooxygenase